MAEDLRREINNIKGNIEDIRNSFVSKEEVMKYWEESRESRREMMDTVKDLSHAVHEVKDDLETFRESTKALVETFNSLQGLVNVLLWIGKVMKPLAVVAVAITGIVVYFQGLKLPWSK